MAAKELHKNLSWLVIGAPILCTLGITPYVTNDPVNLPKMVALSFFASVVAAITIANRRETFAPAYRNILIVLGVFIFNLCLVLLFSGGNISQQLFGVNGRNTGFITYVSLTLLMGASVYVSTPTFLQKFIYVPLLVGFVSMVYGQIQYLNKDPLPWARVYASSVVGFLGNPNFQSALMGMFAVVAFVLIFRANQRFILSAGYGVLTLLAIVGVKESGSQQGYLNFVAGIAIAAILFLFMKKLSVLAWIASGIGIIGSVIVGTALLNVGPLASLLFKSSLEVRAFYWQAAANMTLKHPFFGVGMDHYGNWYFRFRSQEAANYNAGLYSDAAHNVVLDISSYGGFPLLFSYLALIIFVIVAIVKVVKRADSFDATFTAIVSAWVAYQAQLMISINVIGLAVWGWILGGLIIGYEIHTREGVNAESNMTRANLAKVRKATVNFEKISANTTIAIFLGAAIGLAAGLPPFVASVKFNAAIKADDAIKIRDSALIWPHDKSIMVYVAKGLRDIKLEKDAREIILKTLEEFPDSLEGWRLLSTLTTATLSEIAQAKAKMKELDPLNPEFK